MDSIHERKLKDVLFDAVDACFQDEEATATEKLVAITGAAEVLLRYETELDAAS